MWRPLPTQEDRLGTGRGGEEGRVEKTQKEPGSLTMPLSPWTHPELPPTPARTDCPVRWHAHSLTALMCTLVKPIRATSRDRYKD